jgi:DeoR/GlpR family transcriptional regulator of sugar metabolism
MQVKGRPGGQVAISAGRVNRLKRLDLIRQELLDNGEVSTERLSAKLNVSSMTIHRDLESLVSTGDAVRTYGGAFLAKKLTFEFAFSEKQQERQREKNLIAGQAVKHIKESQVILLDTGTTTLMIARRLAGKGMVSVITTSLTIVSELQFCSDIEVILLGGLLRGGSPDMHGPLTEHNVEQFRADVAFIGADSIDDSGNTYTADLRVVNLDRKMAAVSSKVIVVADSSKFGANAMCKVLTPCDYDLIITDSGIGKTALSRFRKKQIEIEISADEGEDA